MRLARLLIMWWKSMFSWRIWRISRLWMGLYVPAPPLPSFSLPQYCPPKTYLKIRWSWVLYLGRLVSADLIFGDSMRRFSPKTPSRLGLVLLCINCRWVRMLRLSWRRICELVSTFLCLPILVPGRSGGVGTEKGGEIVWRACVVVHELSWGLTSVEAMRRQNCEERMLVDICLALVNRLYQRTDHDSWVR